MKEGQIISQRSLGILTTSKGLIDACWIGSYQYNSIPEFHTWILPTQFSWISCPFSCTKSFRSLPMGCHLVNCKLFLKPALQHRTAFMSTFLTGAGPTSARACKQHDQNQTSFELSLTQTQWSDVQFPFGHWDNSGQRECHTILYKWHYLGGSFPMSYSCIEPKDTGPHKACVSLVNVWAMGVFGSEWHTRQCSYFGSLNPAVRRGQNKLKLTLVTSLGSALWEGVSQADSCHFKFHSLGTMCFIFGKRIKQRRGEQYRQIYICFSIYAKPRPLHRLGYQLFRAAIEYIDL